MDNEFLASVFSNAEELAAIKARLQENGMGFRCRPRKGMVHKDGLKK